MKNGIKYILVNVYIFACRMVFGIKKDRVLFDSFGGKSYSDNTRAVSEALHKYNPNLEIVWRFKDPESKKRLIPEYIKTISSKRTSAIKAFATSGCIITNCVFPNYIKSKKQFFIQLWHGDRSFKKILYDIDGFEKNHFCPESTSGYCDLMISGSEFCDKQFRSAFRYPGEIITVGSPRDDVLVNGNPERAEYARKTLGVDKDKKLLLYAPTFRDVNAHGEVQQKQEIDLEKTLDVLEEKYGGEWVCLVRSHPVAGGIGGFAESERLLEVSKYEDMADLLLISDMLITDYSSSATDFTLQNRPVIIFQPDLKDYTENSRNLCFNMEDTPYMVAHSQEELEEIILELTDEKIKENCKQLADFYGTVETGKSAEETAKRICEWLNK